VVSAFSFGDFVMSHSLNVEPASPRFPLGQVVATPASLAVLNAHDCSVHTLLRRHVAGDWGEALHPDDARLNDQALIDGGRILSSYQIAPGIVLWVITESDRSSSTLLMPDDY